MCPYFGFTFVLNVFLFLLVTHVKETPRFLHKVPHTGSLPRICCLPCAITSVLSSVQVAPTKQSSLGFSTA